MCPTTTALPPTTHTLTPWNANVQLSKRHKPTRRYNGLTYHLTYSKLSCILNIVSYATSTHTHERTRSIRWHWWLHLRRAFARRLHHHTVRWEQRILSTSATQKLPTRTHSRWHQHIRHIIQIRWVRPHHSWLPMPRPQLGGQTGRTSRRHTQ